MNNDEMQIRQLITTWMDATKAGDVDTVLGLMTDDVVFLLPGRPPMGKAEFAAVSRPAAGTQAPSIEGHSEIQEITISGDWACMWTRLRVTATPPNGAAPMERAGHTLTVLRKESGKWLLARDANMLTPVDNTVPTTAPHQASKQP